MIRLFPEAILTRRFWSPRFAFSLVTFLSGFLGTFEGLEHGQTNIKRRIYRNRTNMKTGQSQADCSKILNETKSDSKMYLGRF